ncbi:MAG TPA: winged helix-turn-helix domain-containing protein [Roseiarcus sp.]|jgi:TolB-like protein/DNA-binding winged helix-turn-helix (wHTH) protein
MQDVPQERSEADAPPSGEAMAPVCFAGLVFDLSACTLARESGEAIALTRGEFRLLRLFVSRPGRVLSRDAILEAVANRPLELFDRSADALVGRLRRKIEPDPKAPRLIATVAGEGYRFDGLAPALRGALVDGAAESHPQVAAETAAETAPGARPADYPEPSAAPFPNSAASAPPRSWRRPAAAAALVAALLGVGAYAWRPELPTRFMGTGAEDKLANAPRLSIVVLPFENLSGDKEQDYFADGITDDLTTDLSHLQDSFVISRGTAFTYKGKPVDAKAIGKELGVRYLLEGSVRRVGDKVEVNAQLISTETGAEVWADRFDSERNKLGEMQVEVVSRIANSLGVELVKAESLRSMRERPNNPDAADIAMRAMAKSNSTGDSKSINSDVIGLNERALILDPQNEGAMVNLSFALNDRVQNLWSEDPAGDGTRAEKLADSALALQPGDAWAHLAKAQVFFARRQWKAAISQAEAALVDDPNNAFAHANLSFWNMFLGHSEDGFAGLETALRLSPRDPNVPWWQFNMCHLHTHLAQWEQAIEWCGRSIASGNDSMFPYVDLAAANAWGGHDKEASETVALLRKLYPDFTVQSWAGIHWSDDPTFQAQYQRIVEGLRKAGLPEGEVKKD